MKYLKPFNESIDFEFVHKFARTRGVKLQNYKIRSNGVVDVKGGVYIDKPTDNFSHGDWIGPPLQRLPFKFGKVTGFFKCSYQKLTTLDNFPNKVGDYFEIRHNSLKSLEGGPLIVNGGYYCEGNPLTSLVGAPEKCDDFYCGNDSFNLASGKPFAPISIKDLIGGPKSCRDLRIVCAPYLTSLEGCPEMFDEIEIMRCPNLTDPGNIDLGKPTKNGGTRKIKFYGSSLDRRYNIRSGMFISPFVADIMAESIDEPLFHLMKLFPNEIEFDDFLKTFPCIRGNEINKEIFRMACIDFKIEMPSQIKGYKFV